MLGPASSAGEEHPGEEHAKELSVVQPSQVQRLTDRGFEIPFTAPSTLTGEQQACAPTPKTAIRKLLPYLRSGTWTANYVLKYLPTALLPRGPFRLSVKCYPAARTADIPDLKINSGCLVEFGASHGCTSRVSNWGWQAPGPAPPSLHPTSPGMHEKVLSETVLPYRQSPAASSG